MNTLRTLFATLAACTLFTGCTKQDLVAPAMDALPAADGHITFTLDGTTHQLDLYAHGLLQTTWDSIGGRTLNMTGNGLTYGASLHAQLLTLGPQVIEFGEELPLMAFSCGGLLAQERVFALVPGRSNAVLHFTLLTEDRAEGTFSATDVVEQSPNGSIEYSDGHVISNGTFSIPLDPM